MRNDYIKIEHFITYDHPPHRFLQQVCINYNVNGKIFADGDLFVEDFLIECDCKGKIKHETISFKSEYYYNRDPEKFVNSLKEDFKHNTQDDWKKIKYRFHFVTKSDFIKIKKIFREEAWGGLFDQDVWWDNF